MNLKEISRALYNHVLMAHPKANACGVFTTTGEVRHRGVRSPHHQVFAVHRGRLLAQSGRARGTVEAGGFLWLSADFPHDLTISARTQLSTLDFELKQHTKPQGLEIPIAWFAHGGQAYALLTQAAREPWTQNNPQTRRRLEAYLILILDSMERWIHRKPGATFTESQQLAIADLLAKDMSGNLTLAQVANHFSLSPDYFSRRFTQTYGLSFRRHHLEERMKAAAREISLSTEPVGRLALRLGYESLQSFSRLFKQVIGVSPAALRRAP